MPVAKSSSETDTIAVFILRHSAVGCCVSMAKLPVSLLEFGCRKLSPGKL